MIITVTHNYYYCITTHQLAVLFSHRLLNFCNRPVDREVTRSSLELKVSDSNTEPVKLSTVLPTVRHRFDISSKGAVLLGAMLRRWAPPTRYTLWRIRARTMKDLI